MKGTKQFKLLSIILVLAYLLSACTGVATQSASPSGGKPLAKEVAFTGTVEAIGGGEITISGQTVAIDAKTILDSNIKVGDIVKVEAQVSETGAVIALKVESSSFDDSANANDNSANTNDNSSTANDNLSDSNTNGSDNSNSAGQVQQEITGVVEAISTESVTIDGVVYQFASFTEFKDVISVGDQVKLHVIDNADGTFAVREIEKSNGTTIGDDNSNGNSNDDNGNDDNGNDDNGNDDNGNDDNSNGNGNGG